MSTTLTIHDQTPGGKTTHSIALEFPTERVSVRELIRSRVYQEVQDYNRRMPETFHGLVQPTEAERQLNGGYKLRKGREVDWNQQFDKAVEAFQRNGFFVLIDDRQVEELDEEVEIRHGTQVSFVKLLPLVGG
jgi:adenine deaminase